MMFEHVLKFLGIGQSGNRRLIDRLHAQVVLAARQPVFYLEYGVRDDFDGRFDLFCLMSSLVLHRMKQLPPPAQDVAQDFADAVVRHLEIILRQEGIGDIAVPKRLKKYAKSFAGRISAYEAALATRDQTALLGSLRRNFGAGDGQAAGNHFAAERMLRYVLTAETALSLAELAIFTDGQVPFPDAAQISQTNGEG